MATTQILGKLKAESYIPLTYFTEGVPAGFPSPAEGYSEASIDLNELCISHPSATYLTRVTGHSLIDIGVYFGDLMVVDRSIDAVAGDIVVCLINGEFTAKELALTPEPKLIAHNPDYENIELNDDMDFEIFGVVTNIIRTLRKGKK